MGDEHWSAQGDRILRRHCSLGDLEGVRVCLGRDHCRSQVADALKEVFPFAKKHKAASVYSMTIDNLFNDVQLEWENIYSGRYTDEEIMKRLHQLRKLRLDALQHNFPDGLAAQNALAVQAKQTAEVYFQTTYGVK